LDSETKKHEDYSYHSLSITDPGGEADHDVSPH